MNTKNTPKRIVKSFIDLANMTKGLMDENQEPSVQQELEKCGGRRGESTKLHRVYHKTEDCRNMGIKKT